MAWRVRFERGRLEVGERTIVAGDLPVIWIAIPTESPNLPVALAPDMPEWRSWPGAEVYELVEATPEGAAGSGTDGEALYRPVAAVEHEYSERGFARWRGVETDRGERVDVYESSAASGPHLWLSIAGEAHLDVAPRPHPGIAGGVATGSLAAHLTLEQAQQVLAHLSAAVAFMRTRERDWLEP